MRADLPHIRDLAGGTLLVKERLREDVLDMERTCRIPGVEEPRLLVASHIRPWHRCPANEQRLDPMNGLMLTPTENTWAQDAESPTIWA